MKTSFLATIAFLLLGIAGNAIAQNGDKLNPGDKLPAKDITLKSTDGKKVTLGAAMGNSGLLVMFSCNTCPFVIKNQPITNKTIAYAKEHHIGMVIINSNEAKRDGDDSFDEMKKYAKSQGYNVPYVADDNSKLADLFGANHTPEIFLFDNKGTLVYKGAMNDNPGDPAGYKKMYINDAIDALVSGKEINPKTTKSIGCSIKRKA